MNCSICGKQLRAFHYYRDNSCSTYCETCGNPHRACHAAPYRTIELVFSGIQREGVSLTLEIENWPSSACSCLRWSEWNETGGCVDRIDLPANYVSEHTVDEFITEYIMKENKVISHLRYSNRSEFLNEVRSILTESSVFQK